MGLSRRGSFKGSLEGSLKVSLKGSIREVPQLSCAFVQHGDRCIQNDLALTFDLFDPQGSRPSWHHETLAGTL